MSQPQRKRLEPATRDQIRPVGPCVLMERGGSSGWCKPAGDNRAGWELFRWEVRQNPGRYQGGRRLVLLAERTEQ